MAQRQHIDFNSDLGESFGAYRIGFDAELLPLLSSANLACGFHGGDPRIMEQTVRETIAQHVAIGAHPSYPDLVGFGRRALMETADEIRTDVLYQLGALDAFCRVHDVPLHHVKPHGALYNHATRDETTARAIAEAVAMFNPNLFLYAMPNSALENAGKTAGLSIIREAFADRAYNADGTLVSRRLPGAMITNPQEAATRIVQLVTEGRLTTIDGEVITLEADSICIHSDTPTALDIARAIVDAFAQGHIAIQAPVRR